MKSREVATLIRIPVDGADIELLVRARARLSPLPANTPSEFALLNRTRWPLARTIGGEKRTWLWVDEMLLVIHRPQNVSRMPIRGANAHLAAAAFHEAGHALAALREGYQVEFVRISRLWPGAGLVRIAERRTGRNPFFPSAGNGAASSAWQISLNERLSMIRVYLAGPLAEARYLAQPLRTLGAVNDLMKCDRIASTLANLHEELCRRYVDLPRFGPYETIAMERRRVRQWLGRPGTWRSIMAIADVLMQRERLSGEELVQVNLMARSPAHQPVLPLVRLQGDGSATQSEPRPVTERPQMGNWSFEISGSASQALSVAVNVPARIKQDWVNALLAKLRRSPEAI